MTQSNNTRTEYATAYDDTGEPQLHRADCRKLQPPGKVIHGKGLVTPDWYFHADSLEEAKLVVADAYAEDLDLFDGQYDTAEDAREQSLPAVHVLGCAKS